MATLVEGAQEARTRLDRMIAELEGQYDAKLAEASKRQSDYRGDIDALKAEIIALSERLVALINERKAAALAEIDAMAAGPLQRLGAEKAAAERQVSCSRSCRRVAQRLLQEGSDAEIYELTPVRSDRLVGLRWGHFRCLFRRLKMVFFRGFLVDLI